VGGYRVTTAIDPKLQAIAEQMVRERVEALAGSNVRNASLIALDPRTGHVLAYVGSVDHGDQDPKVRGQFDVAGLGERQGGLHVQALHLSRGVAPRVHAVVDPVGRLDELRAAGSASVPAAERVTDGIRRGSRERPVTMRQAIRESMNVPAVKVASLVGVRELAGAYQAVANMGVRVRPTLIARVEDRHGRVVHGSARAAGTAAIAPQMAWLMRDMLKDTTGPATSSIFGSRTHIVRTAALKTGTADDLRDVLAAGYVPQLLTAVWMGNSDNSEMQEGSRRRWGPACCGASS